MKNTPTSTYRVQFTPEYGFQQAEPLVDHLASLGVSHLYASPVFAACTGSQHGYDVVNMNAINGQLGGREGMTTLAGHLAERNIGWVQDIVPNHRAFDGDNHVLMDVLENGPHSQYYNFFDIYWDHPYENIRGRVLAPFLGDFFGRVLERGEMKLGFDERGFRVHYWERSFPIRPESYATLLEHGLGGLRKRLGSHHQVLIKLLGIIRFFRNLDREREAPSGGFDPVPAIKGLLSELHNESDAIREHVRRILEAYNGEPGRPESFELLNQLLSEQYYRLSYWKVGTEELNYRRFFSINDLICVRVEDPEVFAKSHALLFDLVDEGVVQGVRVDHLDGLYDPEVYLRRLTEGHPSLYVVAEKILELEEKLPPEWPVAGTTGYDFLAHMTGLLVDGRSQEAFDQIYTDFTGTTTPYEEMTVEKKRMIVGKHMAGDIDNLALQLKDAANRHRYGRDLTLYSLRRALVEILAQFPIYRTYANDDGISDRDREILRVAIDRSRESLPLLHNELELIGQFILGNMTADLPGDDRARWHAFLLRLQQYTGPVMAKGVEDTSFFLYARFMALNEVGCTPMAFGVTAEEFHAFNRGRADAWPHAMSTTATHDSKWGEDSRARLCVLSEMPDEWRESLGIWRTMNDRWRTRLGTRLAPSRNMEYLLYQAMIASFPLGGFDEPGYADRIQAQALKSAREGKAETSWLNPNGDYERALADFVAALFDPERSAGFQADFARFVDTLRRPGYWNSLVQVVLKCTVPGVPDIYQGGEFWDLSMVDPDNRRPIDFDARRRALEASAASGEEPAARAAFLRDAIADLDSALLKADVLRRLLQARRRCPTLFLNGGYHPLEVSGERARRIVAFSRSSGTSSLVVVAARFFAGCDAPDGFDADAWGDTTVRHPRANPEPMTELFTGRQVTLGREFRVADLLSPLPFAALVRAR